MVQVFDVASYFVTLRESLEAALVAGIVLAYLRKTGNERHSRWVWVGVVAAVLLSLVLGIVFGVLFYRNDNNIFQGNTEKIFEGVTFLVAAALLTWMVVWMFIVSKNLRQDIEAAVERSLGQRGGALRIFALVFFQIFREGIETVILILGVTSDDVSWRAIILPGLLGIGTGVLLAFLMFKGLVQLNLQTFFIITSVVLIAFAAGITSHAFHELQEVDLFGTWKPAEERNWWNAVMWSTKACCNDKGNDELATNEFFAMLRALFGYQDTPTFVEWCTYFAYWFIIVSLMVYIYRDALVKSNNATASYTKASSGFLWTSSFVGFIFACGNANWISITVTLFFFLLSTASVIGAFDAFSQIRAIRQVRKTIMTAVGVGFFVLCAYVFSLTIAQMSCEGEAQTPIASVDTLSPCNLPKFYYWGLILYEDWITETPTTKSFKAIAVLAWSWSISLFLFSFHGLFSLLFTLHIDPSSGNYVYSDSEDTGISYEKVADDDAEEEEVEENSAETTGSAELGTAQA